MRKKAGIRKAGAYVNLAADACAIVTMISYTIAGQDSYGFVPMVDILLAAGIAISVLFVWRDFKGLGPILTMCLFGSGFGVFLNSRFMYYAHQFYGIASDPMSPAMIVCTVGLILMLSLELASGFLQWGN